MNFLRFLRKYSIAISVLLAYYFLVFIIYSLFDLTIVKISIVLIIPSILIFISLNFFFYSTLILVFFFWKYFFISDSMMFSQNFVLFLIAVFYFIFILMKKKIYFDSIKFNYKYSLHLAILLPVLLSTFFARDINLSVKAFLILLQYTLIYLFLTQSIFQLKHIRIMYIVILLSTTIPLIVGLSQVLRGETRIKSTLMNPNEFGGFSAFCIYLIFPLILNSKSSAIRILSYVYLFISSLLLFATESRGAQIAIIASLIVYFYYKNKTNHIKVYKVIYPLMFLTIFILFFAYNYMGRIFLLANLNITASDLDRIGMWYAALILFLESPIIGIGINNYIKYYTQHHPFFEILNLKTLPVAHNLYLNTLAEMGIIGFLTLVYSMIMIFKILYKNVSRESGMSKDIALSLIGFFIYFLIHNVIDCFWTSYAHHVSHMILVFFFFFLHHNIQETKR